MSSDAANLNARLNARLAISQDPAMRERRPSRSYRNVATVYLSPVLPVAEALLTGLPVPARRLEPWYVRELGLVGDVVLDDGLALRVVACGPAISYPPDRVSSRPGRVATSGDTRWPFQPAPDTQIAARSGSLSSVTAVSGKAIR